MITFSEANNGREYVHAFTDRTGIAHTLRASCHSDDESMSGEKAFWNVSDDASSDGVVRTHGAEEENEIYLAMDDLADKIREDFPGVELAFDFAGQILIQMEI